MEKSHLFIFLHNINIITIVVFGHSRLCLIVQRLAPPVIMRKFNDKISNNN